jgi:transmembrane sensor
MTSLRQPLRRVLRAGLDDVAVERVWRRIERRRDAAALPRRARVPAVWAVLLPAAAVLCLALVFAHRPASVVPGPLRLADGSEFHVTASAPGGSYSAVFDDGSMVTLSGGARLEALENDGHAFVTLLTNGAALFDVQPNGPRRWSIECGLATVEVVGTRFGIERDHSCVRVHVEHGVVLVRSERLPDRVQKLTGGGSLEVSDAPSIPPPSANEPEPSSTPRRASVGIASTETDRDKPKSTGATEWRELARRGAYERAYGLLGSEGLRQISESGTVDDWLQIADVARLSGHPGDAVAPLARVASEHPDDPRAPLASFMLGRLELDALGDAPRAAEAFRRAIALGIPKSLLEDAHARLVEACARAGDREAARRAAAEYTARFPGGSRASDVARWVNVE